MNWLLKEAGFTALGLLMMVSPAVAQQNIPGPADVSRILPDRAQDIAPVPSQRVKVPPPASSPEAPKDAANIRFVLNNVIINGVSVFTPDQTQALYSQYLNKEISLDIIWKITDALTGLYRENGYFLSRAYVPQQEIENGTIIIKVVEGYIGHIELDDPLADKRLIKQLTEQISRQRPLRVERLEELVLRLNDLPGHSFRSILKPLENAPEGATQLVLLPSKDKGQGSLSFGNSGSRFLGPFIASATYQDSFIDMQQTSISIAASTQIDELKYGMITHTIPLTPKLSMNFSGNHVIANPGYTLSQNDIESTSTELETGFTFHAIRQWQRNLNYNISMIGRNTDSDILGTALTRDRIRMLEGSVDYSFIDKQNAYHAIDATVTKGLSVFSSSQKNDLNLSRGEARPEFTKVEARYKQQRYMTSQFIATGVVSGQFANVPLYSSEEFGYGGSGLGRAYDNSEITGDRGIAGSLELGYKGIPSRGKLDVTPFVFYDIGKVWNLDQGQKPQSANSIGGGIHTIVNNNLFIDLTIAQPLSKAIETPLYGNGKNPRILMQINSTF